MPITSEDLDYLLTRGAKILQADTEPGVIQDVEQALAKIKDWGLSPNTATIWDFDYALVLAKGNFAGPVGVHPRLYLVFKHKVTGRLHPSDVQYVKKFGTYALAVELLNLSVAKKSDD